MRGNHGIIRRDACHAPSGRDVSRQPVQVAAGLEFRISFLGISSILPCGVHRLRLRKSDRALLAWMTWLWPSLLGLSRVVQPDTILRWPIGAGNLVLSQGEAPN